MVEATVDHAQLAVMYGRNLVAATDLLAHLVELAGVGLFAGNVTRKPRLVPFLCKAGFIVGRRRRAAREPRAIGLSGESGGVGGSHCASYSIVKVIGVERVTI